MLKRLAIGADISMSARAMMMSIGCIQALKCHSNRCLVGVATPDRHLMAGLDPTDKALRCANSPKQTIHSLAEMQGALGVNSAQELRPWHNMHQVSANETKHYRELYHFLNDGDLLREPLPADDARACQSASAETFSHCE
jgi:hypothetical protein